MNSYSKTSPYYSTETYGKSLDVLNFRSFPAQVDDQIKFPVWVPLQNIGTAMEEYSGKVTQVNRVTVDAVDDKGNTWRVRVDEIL